MLDPSNILTLRDGALEDTQEGDTTEERRGIQVGHVSLEGVLVVIAGGWNVGHDGAKEWLQVAIVRQ